MKRLSGYIVLCLLAFGCNTPKETTVNNGATLNIVDFGAVGDGKTINTEAIQKAIDEGAETGKTVIVPKGVFLTGTILLKSNTTLEITTQGVIKGSPNSSDYTIVEKAAARKKRLVHHLIYAKDAENITIKGKGTIDGNCYAFWQPLADSPRWIPHKTDKDGKRLYSNMVELVGVTNLFINDILLKDSPEWTCHLFDCTNVKIDGLRIRNNLFGPNADGLDMSGVQNVMVSNCNIKTCDDAICLKTFPNSRETHNVVITNCMMETSCAAFKMGETYKNISDVALTNCVIKNSSRAIGIYATYGGFLENLLINNVVCNTNAPLVLNRPIQVGVWDKKNSKGEVTLKGGGIRNFTISNFLSTTEGRILITAEDHLSIENLTMKNITMAYPYVEDPTLYADDATSNQFRGIDKDVRRQNAAVVVSNVKNFVLEGLQVTWPKDSIPMAWQHPERIENGSDRVHRPAYDQLSPDNFSAFYGKKLQGGYIQTIRPQAIGSAKPIVIENSSVKQLLH